MAVEGESEELKKTMYQILFCDDQKKWYDEMFKQVTAAGKPSNKRPPQKTVTPMEFIKIRIEEKLKELIA